MYGLPQSGRIAHYALVQHLDSYIFHPSDKTPGLWTHYRCPITLTLGVDGFSVKHSGKEHALHLKEVIEEKYKVTIYLEGKLYIGILLQWDYVQGMFQLSMPGYVCAALRLFQHENQCKHSIHHTSGLS